MPQQKPRIVIVGGGIAGLTAALQCARFAHVELLYKTKKTSSATAWAQGGIAAVQHEHDSTRNHMEDTMNAGYGLCHEAIVRKCVELGPAYLAQLRHWGVPFSESLHREGGHRTERIAHVADHTGLSIIQVLLQRVAKTPEIKVYEDHFAIDVISHDGRVAGLYVLNQKDDSIQAWPTDALILATGGAGKVYLFSSNPSEASGDGMAIALRAGARLANMEFFQFHPTLLYHPTLNNFLITEALRGAGALLLNSELQRFTDELLPRDQVARAIDSEIKRTGTEHVWLDCRQVKDLVQRFPHVVETCRSVGIDPLNQPIPVVPGAHYCCGGVVVDEMGRTPIPGLYCIGENSHTGLHGANRLASNSLLEALVFAFEVSKVLETESAARTPVQLPPWDYGRSQHLEEEVLISSYWDEIRRCMWNFVGLVRSQERLQKAVNRLRLIDKEIRELYWSCRPRASLLELRNLGNIGLVMAEAALQRQESRGLHAMIDYPETSPSFKGEFHCFLDDFGRRHWNWADLPSSI